VKANPFAGNKAPPFGKSGKTTTGSAADKTMKNMVADTKKGKGTLAYTPNKGKK
jgi:hypothetical protein